MAIKDTTNTDTTNTVDQSASINKRGRKNIGSTKNIKSDKSDNPQDEAIQNQSIDDMSISVPLDKQPASIVDSELDTENNEDGSMKTKRRGRKPKDKFRYESTDIDEYQKNSRKDDNIIIKLPLSCLKLNEEFMMGKDLFPYNPNISTPKPADPEDLLARGIGFSMIENGDDQSGLQNHFETLPGGDYDTTMNGNPDTDNTIPDSQNKDILHKSVKNANKQSIQQPHNKCNVCGCSNENKTGEQQYNESRQIDIILNNKYNSNTDKFNVLTHLGMGLNNSKWIAKTDVACLWCCHQFSNTPWGVPFKFTNNHFQLFGNFCTANCTLAYILQNYKDDSMWEKVALLNLLHFKATGQYKNITPAFDKMALKMFGGTLEIEEYRNIINGNEKAYSVEFPPCNTIIPMLEEIYKKTNLNNTFIPVDKNRIQLANNELKLKRSKPVVNHKNTLDFCLGKVSA